MISPSISWPMIRLVFPSFSREPRMLSPKARRCQMLRSEPQKPEKIGRTITCSASRGSALSSNLGRGTSASRSPLVPSQSSFSLSKTSARIVSCIVFLSPRVDLETIVDPGEDGVKVGKEGKRPISIWISIRGDFIVHVHDSCSCTGTGTFEKRKSPLFRFRKRGDSSCSSW